MPAGSTAMSEPDRETRVATRRPPHHRDAPAPARARNWLLETDLVIPRLEELSRDKDTQPKLPAPEAAGTSSCATRPTSCRPRFSGTRPSTRNATAWGARPGDRRVGETPTVGLRRGRDDAGRVCGPRSRHARGRGTTVDRLAVLAERRGQTSSTPTAFPPGAASRAPCKVLLHPVFQPLAGRIRSRQRGSIATGAARSGVTPPPRRRPGPGAF